MTGIQAFGQSISHGLVGGLSSKLSGGSFSKGALISFLNKGASRAVSSVNLFVSTVKHAIFGGAISKYIAGGSFSAGARLAAMATFFNEGGGNVYKFVKDAGAVGGAVSKWFSDTFSFSDAEVRPGLAFGGKIGPVRLGGELGTVDSNGNRRLSYEAPLIEGELTYNPQTGFVDSDFVRFDPGVAVNGDTLTIDFSIKPFIAAIDFKLNISLPDTGIRSDPNSVRY